MICLPAGYAKIKSSTTTSNDDIAKCCRTIWCRSTVFKTSLTTAYVTLPWRKIGCRENNMQHDNKVRCRTHNASQDFSVCPHFAAIVLVGSMKRSGVGGSLCSRQLTEGGDGRWQWRLNVNTQVQRQKETQLTP